MADEYFLCQNISRNGENQPMKYADASSASPEVSTMDTSNMTSNSAFQNNSVSEPNLMNTADTASAVSLLETFAAIARRRTSGSNTVSGIRYIIYKKYNDFDPILKYYQFFSENLNM